MNTVRFNEQFEEIEKQLKRENANATWDCPATWRVAPLFNYVCPYSREQSLLKEAPIETQFRLPFSVLRLSVTETRDKDRYKADYVIDGRNPDELAMLVTIKELFIDFPGSDDLWRRYMPMAFWINEFRWNERDTTSAVLYESAFRFAGTWLQPNKLPPEVKPMIGEMRAHYCNAALDAVAAFALDAMSPAAHIAEVKPDQLGRSVEWTRQRTHYTLIYHGHPINKIKANGNGIPTIRVNQNEELTRMAHARRAHYKTLRHERYRYMRGKTVFVRAAWVGPKEWREAGSKQIYKILEPVEQ